LLTVTPPSESFDETMFKETPDSRARDADDARNKAADPDRIPVHARRGINNDVGTRNDGVIVTLLRRLRGIRSQLSGLRPRYAPSRRTGAGRKRALRTFGPQQERSFTITGSARAKRPAHPKRAPAGQVHVTRHPVELGNDGRVVSHRHRRAI